MTLPDDIRVPLHELQADVDYLIGRVAADESCAAMIAASIKTKLAVIETALLSPAVPQAMPKALDCMEYMPLNVRPLGDDMDEGEHWVIDADNAYVFKLCCSHERAERIVAALNSAYSVTRPHGQGEG